MSFIPYAFKGSDHGKSSLALLELRIVLAKILWKFDMQLVDDKLDWEKENKNYVFWEKPALPVLFTRREPRSR